MKTTKGKLKVRDLLEESTISTNSRPTKTNHSNCLTMNHKSLKKNMSELMRESARSILTNNSLMVRSQ